MVSILLQRYEKYLFITCLVIVFLYFCICNMETNSYIKQFPDIMKGKKIMYVHGFGSSAQSGTVKRLRELLPPEEEMKRLMSKEEPKDEE